MGTWDTWLDMMAADDVDHGQPQETEARIEATETRRE